ncbi:restriction endonuclease subunit S [Pseudoalteromonas sp. 1_2015MBL_MicDiv]|uniref:restriction endonuclease subunit S n=1 Tax=Pseudoalteromonas sp. 1_2015MBL_MicDiv TaxID=1720343 RepID=UPI000BC0F10B|nr:restriction endonuclease subunit S [Pseudoalteromonas sp. 1_2015MBL_MicDiv]ATG79501.1 hypothetical protein AOR04_18255 [Pseudoalteromonas sp. 1_2015MBL_MicDiv]
MELNTETLESLCELVVDCPHSTPKWTDSGIIVLRNQNIKNGVLDLSNPSFTNEEDYQKRVKRAVPRAGDIVITREAPMGEVCIIPEGLKCCLGQRQVLLRPRNEICGEYLFWALQSPYVQHQISWNEGTGTTVSNVRIPVLKALMIPRLPKHEKQSAKILSVLASKLEVNQKTNQTLEQMAQALFKSWFVDFDPVFDNLLASADFKLENLETSLPDELKQKAQRRLVALDSLEYVAQCKASLIALAHELQAQLPTKEATQSAEQVSEKAAETPVKPNFSANPKILEQHASTHAHFPNEFEHNEQLGWIPKGWKQKYLSDLLEVKYGKDHKKLDDGKYPVYGSGGLMRYAESFLYEGESVLIPRKGTLSNIMHINGSFWTVDTMFYTIPKVPKVAKFMFYHLKALDFAAMNVGSAVPSMTTKVLNSLELLFPSVEVLYRFDRVIEDYFNKINFNKLNINQLESLRNTLLPKLISGELQIPDVATDDETVY